MMKSRTFLVMIMLTWTLLPVPEAKARNQFGQIEKTGPVAKAIPWAYKLLQTPEQVLGFLNSKVKPPFCWQSRICVVVNNGLTEYYIFYKSFAQPAPGLWQWQETFDAEGLKNLMNSKAGEPQAQKDTEVFWLQGKFYLLYQATAQKKGWNWAKKVPFDEAVKFLNGKIPYSGFHANARIAASGEAGLPVFYIFHR